MKKIISKSDGIVIENIIRKMIFVKRDMQFHNLLDNYPCIGIRK